MVGAIEGDRDEGDAAIWRGALEHALGGPAMGRSPRSRQLLTYLVEETIAGRRDAITGVTIAQDVLQRDADFDGGDAIVRVQMRRLRLLLAEDLRTAGARGPERRITVPKGAYRPVLERLDAPSPDAPVPASAPPPPLDPTPEARREPDREPPPPDPAPTPAPAARDGAPPSRGLVQQAVYAAAGLTMAILALLANDVLRTPATESPPVTNATAGVAAELGLAAAEPPASDPDPGIDRPAYPTVAVLPFMNQTGEPGNDMFRTGFQFQVASDLQRFGTIRAYASEVPPAYVGDVVVRYVVGGSIIDLEDEVDVFIFLEDNRTGRSIFNRRVVEPSSGTDDRNDYFAILATMSSVISGQIAGDHGDIERFETAREISRNGLNGGDLGAFRCVALSQRFIDLRSAQAFRRALSCIDGGLRDDPQDAILIAYKALLAFYSVPSMGLMDTRTMGWTFSLDEAMAMAERAASLDPGSDVAQAARGSILNAVGRGEEAVASLERAASLNPGNPTIHGLLALALMGQDRWDEALLAAESAIAHSAEPQPFYYVPAFMRALVVGDAPGALRAGREVSRTAAPWGDVLKLIAADLDGDVEEVERLTPLVEAFAALQDGDPLRGLRRWMPSERGVAELERRLTALGIPVADDASERL